MLGCLGWREGDISYGGFEKEMLLVVWEVLLKEKLCEKWWT